MYRYIYIINIHGPDRYRACSENAICLLLAGLVQAVDVHLRHQAPVIWSKLCHRKISPKIQQIHQQFLYNMKHVPQKAQLRGISKSFLVACFAFLTDCSCHAETSQSFFLAFFSCELCAYDSNGYCTSDD